MTHPPLIATLAALAVRLKGGRLVSWVMDLNPDQAIAAGWLREGSLAARLFSRALAFSLAASERVIVLDRFMRERVERKGVAAERIDVVPPWSHGVRYDESGRAAFRAAHGLEGKFVVMHAGNLSLVHPIDTLLEAAERLRNRPDVLFCFVGGGVDRDKVERFAEAKRLDNIRLLPYQPLDRLASVLSAGDLHVVVMGEAMTGIVHPCKIYNVLAVGAPFLYIGPRHTPAGALCAVAPAARRVAHGDVAGAVEAIETAAAGRSLRNLAESLEAARPFAGEVVVPRFTALVSGAAQQLQPIEVT